MFSGTHQEINAENASTSYASGYVGEEGTNNSSAGEEGIEIGKVAPATFIYLY